MGFVYRLEYCGLSSGMFNNFRPALVEENIGVLRHYTLCWYFLKKQKISINVTPFLLFFAIKQSIQEMHREFMIHYNESFILSLGRKRNPQQDGISEVWVQISVAYSDHLGVYRSILKLAVTICAVEFSKSRLRVPD